MVQIDSYDAWRRKIQDALPKPNESRKKALSKKRAGKGSCTQPHRGGGVLAKREKRLADRRHAFDMQSDKQGYRKPGSMVK